VWLCLVAFVVFGWSGCYAYRLEVTNNVTLLPQSTPTRAHLQVRPPQHAVAPDPAPPPHHAVAEQGAVPHGGPCAYGHVHAHGGAAGEADRGLQVAVAARVPWVCVCGVGWGL